MHNQVIVLFSARAVASLSQAVALILLARWTEVSSFALVGSLLGAGMVVIAVLDLGLGTYVLRHGSTAGDNEGVGFALKLNFVTGAIGTVVIAIILTIAANFDPRFYAMIPLAAWMVLEKNSDVLLNVAIARGSARVAAFSILTRRLSALGAFLVFAVVGMDPLWGFTVSLAVGGVIGFADSRRRVYAMARPVSRRRLTYASAMEMFHDTKHYWSANLTNQFRNLDTVLVTSLATATSGAFYAAAVRLTNPILLGTGSLASVLLPAATNRALPDVRRLNRVLLIGIGLVLPLLIVIGWPVAHIGTVILGDEYADAQPAIHVMIIATFIVGMCPVVGALLQSQGGQQAVGRTGVLFLPIILIAVSCGALVAGAVGAAAALGISFFLKLLVLEFKFIGVLQKRGEDMRLISEATSSDSGGRG